MNKLDFIMDYTQAEVDALKIKNYMISQFNRFKNHEDLLSWVKGDCPYFVSEGKDMYSEILSIAKEEVKDLNVCWFMNYINFIADEYLSSVCNKELKTRKRKSLDWVLFFNKYAV